MLYGVSLMGHITHTLKLLDRDICLKNSPASNKAGGGNTPCATHNVYSLSLLIFQNGIKQSLINKLRSIVGALPAQQADKSAQMLF